MAPMRTSSPFTKMVVEAMRELYPEEWADKSFDNTGLLLEAPMRSDKRQCHEVILAVDLTKAVAEEAIERNVSIIIAYHPIIFKPLKSLTLADSQQHTLLTLAQEGISVYCPHTAVDAAPWGLGTWLADVVVGKCDDIPNPWSHDREIIKPLPGVSGAGVGRIVRFHEPQNLIDLATRVQKVLLPAGVPSFPVAIPRGRELRNITVSSVAVCAGSGASVLQGLDVDMLLTGELSHHDTLAAVEKGQVVLTVFHSNSEREYLEDEMRPALQGEIMGGWPAFKKEHASTISAKENSWENFDGVWVSYVDEDPYEILNLK
ncbi:MAG: 40S ribosomal protein S20 [Watsoniomyces obsoletus]|nr:MAG: 40S ribosomal protein S20 [Watsoniomyces obsoletus]